MCAALSEDHIVLVETLRVLDGVAIAPFWNVQQHNIKGILGYWKLGGATNASKPLS